MGNKGKYPMARAGCSSHGWALKSIKSWTLRRLLAGLVVCLGVFVMALGALLLVFGGALLNGYGKRKAERAFAQAHPGFVLRIGALDYSSGANRLAARSVTIKASNATLTIDRISLAGVRWSRLLWGTPVLANVLARTSLDATNLNWEFPEARYVVHCARLRALAPGSELIAEGAELRTLAGDEEFFAARPFRAARFHVVVPACRVLGLAYDDFLLGKSWRAGSVLISGPTLDVLVNRDKPLAPVSKPGLMVNEALAALGQPLQVDSLSVTNGCVRYCEQMVPGANPGVLTISEVNMSAQGIANRGAASAAIMLRGQGQLMDAGTLKVQMTIPISPADFSLHYSGSLNAMDLTRLGAFLERAEHTRIKSGRLQEAAFDIDVTAGQARGHVRGIYNNLEIAVLDKQTGTGNRLDHRVASFLLKELKIRSSNPSDALGAMKEGEVKYGRKPGDEFQQFAWFALRTGVLDIISR
jgi:hypothetical protein